VLDGLRRLIDLQRIDEELSKLGAESDAVPIRRAEAQEAREASEQRVADARNALGEAEHERRAVEAELADKEAHVLHLQGQSAQVKTNKEYTTLLHEIEHDRAAISDCETRILELMDEIDAARVKLAAAEEAHGELEARLSGEETAIESRARELEKDLARAREERTKIVESLEPALLRRYDAIAKSRTPALSIAADELCLGCRVRIPPQAYNDVIHGESIVACGSCHRILVHEGLLNSREREA
jgi:predicted  nucleic acid-binding Zn-ribbon protein